MPYELAIDPATDDLVMHDSGPVLTDTPATSLYLAIAVPVGSFHGDPALGSMLPVMIAGGEPTVDTHAELEAAARTAVERLVALGIVTIEAIEVEGAAVTIHATQLDAPYVVEVD